MEAALNTVKLFIFPEYQYLVLQIGTAIWPGVSILISSPASRVSSDLGIISWKGKSLQVEIFKCRAHKQRNWICLCVIKDFWKIYYFYISRNSMIISGWLENEPLRCLVRVNKFKYLFSSLVETFVLVAICRLLPLDSWFLS